MKTALELRPVLCWLVDSIVEVSRASPSGHLGRRSYSGKQNHSLSSTGNAMSTPLLFKKLVFKKSRLSEGSFLNGLARVSLGYGCAHYDYYVDHRICEKQIFNPIYFKSKLGLGPNPAAGQMFTLLDFGSFLKVARSVGKSLPHSVDVFSMLPNPSKCLIQQKSRKCTILRVC